jgi:hypothetical protein
MSKRLSGPAQISTFPAKCENTIGVEQIYVLALTVFKKKLLADLLRRFSLTPTPPRCNKKIEMFFS